MHSKAGAEQLKAMGLDLKERQKFVPAEKRREQLQPGHQRDTQCSRSASVPFHLPLKVWDSLNQDTHGNCFLAFPLLGMVLINFFRYNLHTIKFVLLEYDSVAFGIVTDLCNYPH